MRKGYDRVLTTAATVLTMVFTVATSHAQDAKTVLAAAQEAMGTALLGNMQFTAAGAMHAAGQSPETPAAPSKVTRYRLDIDYMIPAMRMDVERIGPAPARQIQTVRGSLGWTMADLNGSNAAVAPIEDGVVRIWTSPHGVIKAAEKAGSNLDVAVEKSANGRSVTVLTFRAADSIIKATLNADNRVGRVETRTSKGGTAGVVIETVYSGYKDAKQISATPMHPEDLTGVVFPTRIVSTQGGRPLLDLTVTSARPNAYMVFPIPANIKASAQGTTP